MITRIVAVGVALCVCLLGCSTPPRASDVAASAIASGTCDEAAIWRTPSSDLVPLPDAPKSEWMAAAGVRTKARLNLAYLAVLNYCRKSGLGIPASPEQVIRFGASQPAQARCTMRNDKELLLDAWGGRVKWQVMGGHLLLTSAGADKRFGTSDDIVSPPGRSDSTEVVSVATVCT